jgi:sugar lactone lactonase YvrE
LRGTPLNGPRTIVIDWDGTIYLALREGNAVYRVCEDTRTLHRLAGTGQLGYSGDGGPGQVATLAGPKGLALSGRSLFLADTENHAIRRVDLGSGIITTVLGTGIRGDGPETDPLRCALSRPHGLCVGADGMLYVSDSEAHRIRMLRW